MTLQRRVAELLSEDRVRRFAIFARQDQHYGIVEERILSYEGGDAEQPDVVPFPERSEWRPFWIIDAQPLDGLFGTVEDALSFARLLQTEGS